MLRSLVGLSLGFLLVGGTVIAQETPATHPKSSVHHKSAKRRSASKSRAESPTRVEVFNGSTKQTQVFTAHPSEPSTKRGAKPGPAMTRVDVYNGTSKQMQVFNSGPPAERGIAKPSGKNSKRNVGAAHPLSDVEIFNGTMKERRIFSEAPEETGVRRNGQPVVVGISSSVSESKGKSAPQVVTAVVTTGSEDETGSARPVIGVSPLPPKRPPYRPISPDEQ